MNINPTIYNVSPQTVITNIEKQIDINHLIKDKSFFVLNSVTFIFVIVLLTIKNYKIVYGYVQFILLHN